MSSPTTPPAAHATFVYRALRSDGGLERGVLTAATQREALNALAARGLSALDVRARHEHAIGGRRMPVAQLALGLRVLADFLESGLPLGRALASLEELAPPRWRAGLPAVRASVREGKSLAAALSTAPFEIPSVVLGILRAGEAGSGLAAAVRRAAEITEEAAATRAAIRGALAYPILLAATGAAAVILLVSVVLPRFATILAGAGQSVPPLTQLVLSVAELVTRVWSSGALVVLAGMAAWYLWRSTDRGQRAWHAFLLSVPVYGRTRASAAMGRSCAALAALLESGVPLATALVHAAQATGDAALCQRLLTARDAVMHGSRLSTALADHHAASATVIRLVRAGEESGRLTGLVAHAGRLERDQAIQRTRAAVRMLEPTLILIFGGLVALVAAALLQAMYSIRPGA